MKEIFERVSIRRYQDRPVEREKILALLRAAMAAPSAANQQPWEFYVVTDREKILALSEATPYSHYAAQAPVVIVPVYREETRAPSYAQIDLSIAMENLWLSCGELGLGGAFHDYMSGMISLRNGGEQMPSLMRRFLGGGVYRSEEHTSELQSRE